MAGERRDRTERPDPPEESLGGRDRIRAYILLALTVGAVVLCALLALPFLPALTWALALAVLFAPANRWLESKVRSRDVAAGVSVALIGAIVVAPATYIFGRVTSQAASGAKMLSETVSTGAWRTSLEKSDYFAPILDWVEQINFSAAFDAFASWMTDASASFVTGSVMGAISLVLTFYLLFYFLRDRAVALDYLRGISPLTPPQTEALFRRIKDIIFATLYGTLTVAIVQGALGGLAFWWLGLPAPLLWGTVMGLFALVPVLGAFVVWIPAAAFLALEGSWEKALVLIVWGSIVVGGIDNLLYPMLVGRRLQLHTVPAFIAILGGLFFFGASGLLLGPMVVAVTIFLFEIWHVEQRGAGPTDREEP
ncbi:putative inner membrane protein [Methyloligella halotolerans]|uniref:Putative inner membrane protein n=1 Tax=Methyloligella halotolerans TaxID=1177755 RepID=A0A1E2S032_9HYPH|nr:AI-2E family transporter [Methyloligella halotolerans]ODA67831.1 putative inner membrane protein [Methyloligella halotolerans]